jgi:hypothetical protein
VKNSSRLLHKLREGNYFSEIAFFPLTFFTHWVKWVSRTRGDPKKIRGKIMKALTGNTYPVKDQIKAMGGKWDADKKAWMVPDKVYEQAVSLVSGAPKSQYKGQRGGYTRRNEDDECELCGKNKYTCGHCIGW